MAGRVSRIASIKGGANSGRQRLPFRIDPASGATLSFAGDGTPRTKEVKKLNVYAKKTVLEIGAGVVLTADVFSLVDLAQLDVRADAASGALLVVPGKKGRVANVTLNGRPAAFRNGALVERGGLVILLK